MPPKHPVKLQRYVPVVKKELEEVRSIAPEEVDLGLDATVSSGLFSRGVEVSGLQINGRLKEGIVGQGFKQLTNVQAEAFSPVMCDKDVLIKSETGSGKTIAYMLPIVEKILRWTETNRIDRTYGLIGLVLVPTRELAEQCFAVLTKTLQKVAFIVPGCIMGGEQRKKEKARLRHGVHILVATVGRLLDHMRTTESFNITHLRYLVLDEADRLLDMGYESDITTIRSILTTKKAPVRQSILVSATLGEDIKRLSHFILNDPVIVGGTLDDDDKFKKLKKTTGEDGEEQQTDGENNEDDDDEHGPLQTPDSLKQHYALVPTRQRLICLLTFLKWKLDQSPNPTMRSAAVRANVVLIPTKMKKDTKEGVKIIVFFSSADAVEYHYKLLSELKVRSGDKHPLQRRYNAAEKAERKTQHKQKKFSQKRKIHAANTHLEHDDEEGFVEFSDESEEEEEGLEDGDAGMVPFIGCDLFKLHGNMGQVDRASIFEAFRRCTNGIMLATDIASRGLDMPGISWVIQYDPALDRKSYTHRIGRTARAGLPGDAVTFVQPHEEAYISHLTKTMDVELNKMTPELILFQLAKLLKHNHLLEAGHILHDYCERAMTNNGDLRRMGAIAYQAYLRAYTAYPKDVMHIFNVKNMHLGHVARSFAIAKNPTNLGDVARSGHDTGYEPTLVRKRKTEERHANKGLTLEEADAAAAKKAFRKPIATSRVGQFNEFASGDAGIDAMANLPMPKRKKK